MEKANYREILLNSYLSISDSTSGLKEIGYAKLVFLILFLEDNELNVKEIVGLTSKYINSISIPEISIINALNLLKSRRLIKESADRYSILSDERIKTEKQLEYSKKVSINILEKHFPKMIPREELMNWFNDANERYFSTFADRLIQLYNKKNSLILEVEKILSPLIDAHKLTNFREELLQGYKEFLLSSDRDEEEKIWNIMQSLLAAKIVTVDLSPDFLSIDKYNNSEILLDTNILFANSLASGTGIQDTVNSFGKIAKTIGAKLFVAKETIDEYKVVCERKKIELITLWNNYSIDILKKADRKDSFFRSLLILGCCNEDDIERFFSIIKNPPEKIGDSKINIIDHGELYDKVKDRNLFDNIKQAWSVRHGGKWEKSENVVIHDLLITKICQRNSQNKKMFALTMDLSLEALSLKWVSDKEDPIWRSLHSLVQVLAINGGGPDFNPSDMAPLVKIFIEQEDLGRSDDFDKRDLLKLTELSERIKELSDTKIISLLNKIHQANMSSTCDQQILKDVKLELERSLVKRVDELNEVITEKDEKINTLQGELNKEKNKNEKNHRTNLIIWFVIRFIVCASTSFLLFIVLGNSLLDKYKTDGVTYEVIQISLFVLSPALYSINDYRKTFKKF